jgi:hypothetical protein
MNNNYEDDWWIDILQSYYVKKILDNFLRNDWHYQTLIKINVHLLKNKVEWIYQSEYSWIIMRMYIINCTIPDLVYSISKLNRFTSNTNMGHYKSSTPLTIGYIILVIQWY